MTKLEQIQDSDLIRQAKLLLHVCCGPCAMMTIKILIEQNFSLHLFFHNPNIHPLNEYLKRREGAKLCAEFYNLPISYDDQAWDLNKWLAVKRPATPPDRCINCCLSRLEVTKNMALSLNIPFFSTSLLYSIYQPHEAIREWGEAINRQNLATKFVYLDFRSEWQAGIDASKDLGLYRQSWCGCIYSESERYQKKLQRLIKEEAIKQATSKEAKEATQIKETKEIKETVDA